MKVILKDNVLNLGQKDDIKEVKSGYWRNFLLPQGLAVEATPNLIGAALKRKEEREKQKEQEEEKISEALEKTKDENLILKAKADEKGSLFEGIDVKKISEAIKKQIKIDIPENLIVLEKPIKKTGSYKIKVSDRTIGLEIKSE